MRLREDAPAAAAAEDARDSGAEPGTLLNRNLAMLTAAQVVGVSGTVGMVTLGGILGQRLAPTPALATLPLSGLIIGTAVFTVGASWLMSRIGRPKGFAVGALVGCAGYLTATLATALASYWTFCIAVVMVGAANAFAQQYRFAAVESAPRGRDSQAISIVLVGSLGGAIFGPGLAAAGEDWIAGAPFAGAFVVVAAAYVVVALFIRTLAPGRGGDGLADEAPPRPLGAIARQPLFLAAVLGGVAGYGAMTFIMTAAPLSMHVVEGHSMAATAGVIQAHVVAMYAPSLVTGFLIARFGIGGIMGAGTIVLASTLVAGLLGRDVMHYAVSMIALGVGWNFLYIGGTALLGRAHRASERFRAQAVNEFSVFGMSAAGSLGAGAVMHYAGWEGVLLAGGIPIAAALVALAWVRPDRRLGTA